MQTKPIQCDSGRGGNVEPDEEYSPSGSACVSVGGGGGVCVEGDVGGDRMGWSRCVFIHSGSLAPELHGSFAWGVSSDS